MTRPSLLSILALAALVALGFSLPEADSSQADGIDLESASHTVEIRYQERRGTMRQATIRLVPRERARPAWRGEIQRIAVLPLGSTRWVVSGRVEASRDGSLQVSARIPAPDRLGAFAIRTDARRTYIFPRNESVAYGDGDDDKDDPPTENPDDPKDPDDGGGDDGGDDEGCANAASCIGIIDPWTCECDSDIKDPWENERQVGSTVSFGI